MRTQYTSLVYRVSCRGPKYHDTQLYSATLSRMSIGFIAAKDMKLLVINTYACAISERASEERSACLALMEICNYSSRDQSGKD